MKHTDLSPVILAFALLMEEKARGMVSSRHMTKQEWTLQVHQLFGDMLNDLHAAEPLDHAARVRLSNSFVTVAVELALLLDAMGGLNTEAAYELKTLLRQAIDTKRTAGIEYINSR